ncbi:uncharacterized protein LTR77_007279 [Saxophila tyrrhenica]|uniref:Small ribosomal subunit protein bS6m n=1 Tax=Saxophila tyrrhenica TaxID=1690608 RepID=A0AAV9P4Y8_9PEZI|nr:hypothetical protein LTR77_007279 [Saxophila tyrrhenica]
MLYELIGVVSHLLHTQNPQLTPPRSAPAAPSTRSKICLRIAKTTGNQILSSGGVVRGITNWGTFLLPKPARKAGTTYHQGQYFILRFDSSAKTQHAVRRTLGLDPRMIRFSVVKMGSKLDEIAEVRGKAEWEGAEGKGSG